MATLVDRLESIGVDASLAAVLVTGFTALAMIQCRQPVRRRAWGRSGLAASLLLVPLAWLNPLPRIDLRHPTSSTRNVELHPPRNAAAALAPRHPESPTSPAGTSLNRPLEAPAESRLAGSAMVWHGLLFLYGCGLLGGLVRLSLGVVGSSRLIRHTSAPSEWVEALLAELPYASRIHQRPRVRISDRMGRPVLVGFIRPTILIPPSLDHPEAEARLRLGLLHELAHAEVGDSRYGMLAALAQAVWFYLPQVWWVRSQLRLDAEFLADHRAVSNFGTSYHYAESLVGLAMAPPPRSLPPEPSTAGLTLPSPTLPPADPPRGLASALLQRVQMLLKCPFEVEDQAPRRWVAGSVAMMLVWTLGASCLSIQDPSELQNEISLGSIDEATYALRLTELEIDARLLENRLFNLRFRLPPRFQLVCEVLADPAELAKMEIVGYRLDLPLGAAAAAPPVNRRPDSSWRRVEISREASGQEAVHVDGRLVVPSHQPTRPESWLTIRPIPGRKTRLHLELTW